MGQGFNASASLTPNQQSQDFKDEERKMPTTDELIEERGKTYGNFKDGAGIMQSLKQVMHTTPGWNSLRPEQKEALDMIQHKIGRILNGNSDYIDSWDDIAGYSQLVAEILRSDIF